MDSARPWEQSSKLPSSLHSDCGLSFLNWTFLLLSLREICFFINLFLLVFNLPTYRITPSAHLIKCLPQCLAPIHPHPSPTSPSITPSSSPRVRSLSCSVSLSDISHSFFSPFPFIPFHYFYIQEGQFCSKSLFISFYTLVHTHTSLRSTYSGVDVWRG